MQIGDLVTTSRYEKVYIGMVRKTDFRCPSTLTVFIYWFKSGHVSWEDPSHLELL